MVKKKSILLNSTPCGNCGACDSKIYYGNGQRKNCKQVQLIRCISCKKVMLAESDPHPLARKTKNRDQLLKILKDLAKGKSIRKTAVANQVSPSTVVSTEKTMQKFIRGRLDNIASETGLSVKDIAGLIQRITQEP